MDKRRFWVEDLDIPNTESEPHKARVLFNGRTLLTESEAKAVLAKAQTDNRSARYIIVKS